MSHKPENPPPYTPAGPQPAAGYNMPPQQQYHPVPNQAPYPTQPPTTVIYTQPQPQPTQVVTVTVPVGARCPHCQAGVVRERFTLCGILWAIFCFPIGFICMFTMTDTRCGTCGASF